MTCDDYPLRIEIPVSAYQSAVVLFENPFDFDDVQAVAAYLIATATTMRGDRQLDS